MPNYLEPEYLTALVKGYNTSPDTHKEEMGSAILLIATMIFRKYQFHHHNIKDACISEACFVALRSVRRCDPNRGGAFAYLTEACLIGIRNAINQERRLRQHLITNSEMTANGEIL